ncbi:MAG: hypothetical protein WC788_00485 [Candidatus Paceibacterota bacterium]|jgi:hypothetical protein
MEIKSNYRKIIIIAIVAMIIFGGYSVWKSYSDQKGITEGESVVVPVKEIDTGELPEAVSPEIPTANQTPDDRDNQRVKDLGDISYAIDEYAKYNQNEYPITNGYEKISDENSYIYKLLRQDWYLKKNYIDPLSGSRFYGYRSDGKSYELTAAFEDTNDPRCEPFGNLCVYIVKKP